MKKILPIVLMPLLLTSCFDLFNDEEGVRRLKTEYGTIQKFLDHGSPKYNYVDNNYYPYFKYHDNRCYDKDALIYERLYAIGSVEIKKEEIQYGREYEFRYSIPYDDAAYITLNNRGYGSINVVGDIFGPCMTMYIKTDENQAKELNEFIQNYLCEFYDK